MRYFHRVGQRHGDNEQLTHLEEWCWVGVCILLRLVFPSAPGVNPLLMEDGGREPTGVAGTELDKGAFDIGRITFSLPASK